MLTTISTIDASLSLVKISLYFQKYYQEQLRGVTLFCQICNKYVAKDKKVRHAKTKKHIKNNDERERQIERERTYIYI